MTTDEQDGRTSGSVPNAYRNALFWRWVPAMPPRMPSGFIALLYALAAAADPAGQLRFRDGKAIRLSAIAAAVHAEEKVVRRYLEAAVAAGVVAVEGERRRGRATQYALLLSMAPDWTAAVESLEKSRRQRPDREAPVWRPELGGPTPQVEDEKFGGPSPQLEGDPDEKVRGPAPLMSSGARPPKSSGARPPNNPGVPKVVPMGGAGVVPQPQPLGGSGPEKPTWLRDTEPGFIRCARCHEPMLPRAGRDTHAHCAAPAPPARQLPLMFGVPSTPPAPAAAPEQAATDHADTA